MITDCARNFDELQKLARRAMVGLPPVRVAVAAAEDESSLIAMEQARATGMCEPLLIGDERRIHQIMDGLCIDRHHYRIYNSSADDEKAAKAVELVVTGRADVMMKGLIPTSTFLHPVFQRGSGLISDRFISHVAVIEVRELGRLLVLSDGGINISPDYRQKQEILHNAVVVAHLLGMERPKVAVLSASEKVHPKIQSAVDARDLSDWAREAGLDADVDGPLALDLAVSEDAAARKKVGGIVAGRADVLIAPNIEVGNVVYKALRFFAHAEAAGIAVGAGCPIILTSRSDPPREKINSLALAALYMKMIR